MSGLKLLNSACVTKPYKSFNDLDVGDYIVERFSYIDTKNFGKRIRMDFDEFHMYLPERFNIIAEQNKIDELNAAPKILHFEGKDYSQKGKLLISFKEVPYIANLVTDFHAK